MNNDSTLVPNPANSFQNEIRSVTWDLTMAIYNDDHSGSNHCIAYPAFPRPRLRNDLRITGCLADEKKRPARPSLREGDLFYDSLVVSGTTSGPRNPLAVVGSVALLSLVSLALVVIPLFHLDALPKAERLTMLYFQPPSAAGARSTNIQAPKPTSTYTRT